MAYLPKHYVKTGFYANAGDFTFKKSKQPYTGVYYTIATGQYFSGTGPQDRSTQEIILISPTQESSVVYKQVNIAFNPDTTTLKPGEKSNEIQNRESFQIYQPTLVNEYLNIKQYPENYFTNKSYPYSITPIPDTNEYIVGEYTRFFCKKINETTYLELDYIQYIGLSQQDPKYFWEQFITFSIPWTLTGDKEQVRQINKSIVNRRMNTLKLYNFDTYLQKDYLKFYKQV